MAGRPTNRLADTKVIQKLFKETTGILNTRPLIVLTMRACGCTYAEIGEVFGVSKQMIETIVKSAESKL